jgi:hypothetical protein
MLIRISSFMFSFLTSIPLKYGQFFLLVSESGLFNSNKWDPALTIWMICSRENKFVCLIYSKQQWTPCVSAAALPRDIQHKKHCLLYDRQYPVPFTIILKIFTRK